MVYESSAQSNTGCNLGINWAMFLSGDLIGEECVSKFSQVVGRIHVLGFFKATRRMCLHIREGNGLSFKDFQLI